MLVFLDESGDPGFKTEKGSSPFFVINLVTFNDDLEAEKTAVAIKELRRELKHSDFFEFKFNKTPKEEVLRFLEVVNKFDWKYRAIVVRKDLIRSSELKNVHESFYNYMMKLVLKHHGGTIQKAKLRVDGRGSHEFKRSVTTYLRLNLPKGTLDTLRFRNSQSDVLIQMADIIAGSIHRSYQPRKDKGDYISKIKRKHEGNVWEFH